MKVILHPGLHKTGTTAIQKFLLSVFGSEEPGPVWYPMRPNLSPGHANLPYHLRREALRDKGLEIFREYVDQATRAGTELLLISAEDFCKLDAELLARIRREVLGGHELHLVFTLTAYLARAVSQWQENVKHGRTLAIDHPSFNPPQLRPTLVGEMIAGLNPDRIDLIIGCKSNSPEWLLKTFVEAASLQDAVAASGIEPNYAISTNRSFGRVEIEMIRHLNLCFEYLKENNIEHDAAQIRKRFTGLLISPAWKSEVTRLKIDAPPAWLRNKRRKNARMHFRDLKTLVATRNARVFGELGTILDGLDL